MASTQDGNLGIWSGYTPGDNGWTAQHNSNWDALDALVQCTVKSITITTPPGSPANGDAYIVPSGATGAWASQTNKIAVWVTRSSAWVFYTPKNGWQFYNQADLSDYVYNGSAWVFQGSPKLNVTQDYIGGLKMVWNSATSISVTTGSAYIASLGRLCLVNSTLTLSSLSLTASTWYHLYLFENSGTPTLECVTTAPAAPYYGTARAKTSDTTRRYVGSVKTDGSGNIYKFANSAGAVMYQENVIPAPFQVLNNGAATTPTNVDLSAVVPVTSTLANAQLFNNTTNTTCTVANPDVNFTLAAAAALYAITSGLTTIAIVQLSSDQKLNYMHSTTPSANGMIIRVIGYVYER